MPVRNTRAKIVEAAMELFWLKGYGSTSIADILSRTQLNSGSLYHYFPGKQDVLIAVLESYRNNISQMLLEPAWTGIDDPIDRIFALLALYRRLILESDCAYGCPIGSLALELHEADPAVRRRLAENFEGWAGAASRCLDEARDRLPSDTNPKSLGEFVLTIMEGGVMLARTHRDVGYFDRAVAHLRGYLDGLATAAEKEKSCAI